MNNVLKSVDEYYTKKLKTHGPTPAGVDWNGESGQHLRFDQLIKVIANKQHFTIADLGCGYGELYTYLKKQALPSFSYVGIDISKEMVQQAQSLYKNASDCQFQIGSSCKVPYDYCVASGIFNVKLSNNEKDWKSFIIQTLHNMYEMSTKGMACNFLTSYSDTHMMKDNLYYADPLYYFDYCKKNLCRNVTLLHDYGLYEFTLILRI